MQQLFFSLVLFVASAAVSSAQAQQPRDFPYRHLPVRIMNVGTWGCMDAGQSASTPGTPVQQHHRLDRPSQTFILQWLGGSDFMLRSSAADPRYVGITNTMAVLQELNPSPAQVFTFRHLGNDKYEIRSKDGDQCLSVPGSSTADGIQLQAMACNNSGRQHWNFEVASYHGLQLQAVHSNLCLDVEWGSTDPGRAVLQYECLGQENQRWLAVPSATSGLDQSTLFKLKAKHSGLCLEAGPSGASQNTCSYQYWKIVTRADGFVQLQLGDSDHCLGFPETSLSPSRAQLLSCNGGTNTAFTWVP